MSLLPAVGRGASPRLARLGRVRWALLAIGIATLTPLIEVANFFAALVAPSGLDPSSKLSQRFGRQVNGPLRVHRGEVRGGLQVGPFQRQQ